MQSWNTDWPFSIILVVGTGLIIALLILAVRRERARSAALQQFANAERTIVERFERLSTDAGIVFWLINLETGHVQGNSLWRKRWGYQPEEVITLDSFKQRISALFRKRIEETVEQVIKTSKPVIFTELGQANPIAGSWQRLRFAPAFNELNQLTTIEITAVDVTQEVELIQRAEAQQRREQQMYAVIGHELRTPASILKMQVDRARRRNDELDRNLLNTTLDQLFDVIDTLRTVSQPEEIANTQLTSRMLQDLISEQVSLLKVLADEKRIALSSNYPELENTAFKLPVGALKQLISNLVRNAIIHAQCNKIELNLSILKLTEKRSRITLEVRDNGIGISSNELERLFKPYEKGDKAFNGSGLGLYVCQTIAQLIGGTLNFEPNPEGGAIFKLEWEAERAAQADLLTEKAHDPTAVLPGLSALLVEDDNAILQMTAMILSDYGVKVRIAKNGLQAAEIFDESQTDLVLTDIFMPVMSGVELVSELRSRGANLPIIAVTAATLGQETEAISRAGADAVLTKPLNPTELAKVIGQTRHAPQ